MATNPDKELSQTLDQIRADLAALSQTVAQLVADGADVRAALKKKVDATARQAAAAGEDLLGEAADMANDAMAAAGKQATAAVDSIEAQVVRNPMAAVLIALGLGFIVGVIGRK